MRYIVLSCVLFTFLGASAASSDAPPAERTVDAEWALSQVTRNPRVLQITYVAGGCLLEDGRAVVVEGPNKVRITVKQTKLVDPEVACRFEETFPRLLVRLARPVAGRLLVGQTSIGDVFAGVGERRRGNGPIVPVIPRVTGLSGRDALALLERQRFQARVRRVTSPIARPMVLAQNPRPGTLPRDDDAPFGPVTLTISKRQH